MTPAAAATKYDESEIYDRQIRLWGAEAQVRLKWSELTNLKQKGRATHTYSPYNSLLSLCSLLD